MKLQDKQIAIVGGGPGGLILARLLQLKGATVKVYERDFNDAARVQGSPLDMHEHSGLAALRKANLIAAFETNFLPGADRELITNERAEVFFNGHEAEHDANFGSEHFRPEIDRGALRKIMLESLKPGTVVWDSHCTSMEKQGEGWLLHFKNGSVSYADVVVAADGANSKIRSYITDIKPFYSGITMLEGNIYNAEKATPQFHEWLKGGKIMAFGNEKCILGGQKNNNDLGFYLSFKTDENWAANSGLDYSDKTQLLEWFKINWPQWSPFWNELIENTTTPFIPRPIYCMPLDQTWNALSNLTMLGDAAHVMPPFAGEGANMAMLDALELSENLTSDKFDTVKDAIADYEMNMRKRAAAAAQESIENGEKMHSEDALKVMLEFFSGN